MIFYGNGIVKVGSKSLRFSKPEVRYQKGILDTEDRVVISTLVALGYENDGNYPKSKKKVEEKVEAEEPKKKPGRKKAEPKAENPVIEPEIEEVVKDENSEGE